ncbi:hypothetical protein BDY21DRAFT_82770, partial [Lineolata rhizophorae]
MSDDVAAAAASAFETLTSSAMQPTSSSSTTGAAAANTTAMTDEAVIAAAMKAIEASREETRRSGVSPDGATKELQQPGITIDLGHQKIQRLPDEVIDIIKDDIERLALSHNQVSYFPQNLVDCTRLRYLNVRWNNMTDFPRQVLQLSSLEILDVSRNQIRSLPEEISSLTSLKVFAITKNKIERLPYSLGDMNSLAVLKFEGNPLQFPPADVLTIRQDAPVPANDNEKDVTITTQVKRYLRQATVRERLRVESDAESSEGNVETPRPARRGHSRFPIRPSISGIAEMPESRPESPGAPPPIPVRSHQRIKSQHNSVVRRPAIAPLVIANDRNRSQSESLSSANQRTKRMGIITSKNRDLGTVDESIGRNSGHSRGYSTNSAASGTGSVGSSTSSTSALNTGVQADHAAPPRRKGGYRFAGSSSSSRPIDSLERGNRAKSPYLEPARLWVYHVSRMYRPLRLLGLRMLKTGQPDRISFHYKVIAAYMQLKELMEQMERFEKLGVEDSDGTTIASTRILEALIGTLDSFGLLTDMFVDNIEFFSDLEGFFLRDLLTSWHSGLVEVRFFCFAAHGNVGFDVLNGQPNAHGHGRSLTPTQPPTIVGRRLRNGGHFPESANGISQLSKPPPLPLNGDGHVRGHGSGSITSATPRSTESFASIATLSTFRPNHRNVPSNMSQFAEDGSTNSQFEEIYSKLVEATERSLSTVPDFRPTFEQLANQERGRADKALPQHQHQHHQHQQHYERFLARLDGFVEATLRLKKRMGRTRLGDNQPDFWHHVACFTQAWVDMGEQFKAIAKLGPVRADIKLAMRQIQTLVKEGARLVETSPWNQLATLTPPRDPNGKAGGSPNGVVAPQLLAQQSHAQPHHHPVRPVGAPPPTNTTTTAYGQRPVNINTTLTAAYNGGYGPHGHGANPSVYSAALPSASASLH